MLVANPTDIYAMPSMPVVLSSLGGSRQDRRRNRERASESSRGRAEQLRSTFRNFRTPWENARPPPAINPRRYLIQNWLLIVQFSLSTLRAPYKRWIVADDRGGKERREGRGWLSPTYVVGHDSRFVPLNVSTYSHFINRRRRKAARGGSGDMCHTRIPSSVASPVKVCQRASQFMISVDLPLRAYVY